MRQTMRWWPVLVSAWLGMAAPARAEAESLEIDPPARPLLEVEARFRLGALPLDRPALLMVTVRNTGRAASRETVVEVLPPMGGFAEGLPGSPPLATARLGRIPPGAEVRRGLTVDVRGLRPGAACFPVRVRAAGPSPGGGHAITRACVALRERAEAVTGGSGPPAPDSHVVEVRSVTALDAREGGLRDLPTVGESGFRVRVRIEARRVRGGPVPPLEVAVVETPQGGGASRVAARYRTTPLMVAGGWDQREVTVAPGGPGPRCYDVRVQPAPGVRVLPRAAPVCVFVEPSMVALPEGLVLAVLPRGMALESFRPGELVGRVRAGEPLPLDLLVANRSAGSSPAMTVAVTSRARVAGLAGAVLDAEIARVRVPALAPGERRRVPFEFRFSRGGERRCLLPQVRSAGGLPRLPVGPCYEVEGPAIAVGADGPSLRECPPGLPPSECRGPARAYRFRDGTVVNALRLAVSAVAGPRRLGDGRFEISAEARLWNSGPDPIGELRLEVLPAGPGPRLLLRSLRGELPPRRPARRVPLRVVLTGDRLRELAGACLRVRALGSVRAPGGRRPPAVSDSVRLCPRGARPRDALGAGLDARAALEAVRRSRPRVTRVRLTRRSVDGGLVRYLGAVFEIEAPRTGSMPREGYLMEVGVRRRDGRVDWRWRGNVRAGGRPVVLDFERHPIGYGDCAVARFEGEPWPRPGSRASGCVPEPPHLFVTVGMNGFNASLAGARPGMRLRPCIEARAGGRGTRSCAARTYPVPRGGGWIRPRGPELPQVMVAVPRGSALEVRLFLETPGGRIVRERRDRLEGPAYAWVGGRFRHRSTPDASFAWGILKVEDPSIAGRRPRGGTPRLPPGILLGPERLRDAMGR